MSLTKTPKRHRFPISIISQAVWLYYRFNHSYRDVQEQLAFRGITLSHETVRKWCSKFALHFIDVIKNHARKPNDKWHLDEMTLKINGECLSYGELLIAVEWSSMFFSKSVAIRNQLLDS